MTAQPSIVETPDITNIPNLNLENLPFDPAALMSAVQAAVVPQEIEEGRVRVGVVGFSSTDFDQERAKALLEGCLATLDAMDPDNCLLVSGLTDLGVPGIAYRVAAALQWPTAGYACAKAKEYNCYPVDEEHIIGEEWGDESEEFLANIDILVRVGGGDQSKQEFAAFEGPKWELPL